MSMDIRCVNAGSEIGKQAEAVVPKTGFFSLHHSILAKMLRLSIKNFLAHKPAPGLFLMQENFLVAQVV